MSWIQNVREEAIAFVRQTVANYKRAISLPRTEIYGRPPSRVEEEQRARMLKIWETILEMIDPPKAAEAKAPEERSRR